MSVRRELEARLREEKRSLANYQKRQQDLDAIISSLSGCAGDGFSEINDRINKIGTELQSAVSNGYIRCVDALASGRDRGLSDGNISGADSNLKAERRVVENKMSSIRANIRSLEHRIEAAKEEERRKAKVF